MHDKMRELADKMFRCAATAEDISYDMHDMLLEEIGEDDVASIAGRIDALMYSLQQLRFGLDAMYED